MSNLSSEQYTCNTVEECKEKIKKAKDWLNHSDENIKRRELEFEQLKHKDYTFDVKKKMIGDDFVGIGQVITMYSYPDNPEEKRKIALQEFDLLIDLFIDHNLIEKKSGE